MRRLTGLFALLAIVSCSDHARDLGQPLPAPGGSATAMVRDVRGAVIGRAIATDVQGGMRVTLEAEQLPSGAHGVHVHTVGRCDPPDFASAGGHWNPLGTHHGSLNASGPHLGDLPNLIVPPNGHATLAATIPGATVAALLEGDGSALVVHAGQDDMMTDPAGNSGARIACGIFAAHA